MSFHQIIDEAINIMLQTVKSNWSNFRCIETKIQRYDGIFKNEFGDAADFVFPSNTITYVLKLLEVKLTYCLLQECVSSLKTWLKKNLLQII